MSFKKVLRGLVVGSLAVLCSGAFAGAVIGSWSGGGRTWNSANMTSINAAMQGAGHTVEANEALTAANLANDDILVLGEPGATPTAGELADLSAWVNGGGILLIFADSSNSGLPHVNNISAALGTGLTWAGGASTVSAFATGNFAIDGGPFNLVGQTLATSSGTAVSGGTALAGDFIHYTTLGAGHVFGFADRSDHNIFTNPNRQFFLNIAAFADTSQVPEPGALWLVGASLLALGLARKSRVS